MFSSSNLTLSAGTGLPSRLGEEVSLGTPLDLTIQTNPLLHKQITSNNKHVIKNNERSGKIIYPNTNVF